MKKDFPIDEDFYGLGGSSGPSLKLDLETLVLFARAVTVPIPRILRPEFALNFQNCVVCDIDLVANNVSYLVFKAFHHEEVIVEMAICSSCLGILTNVYSQKTRQAMDQLILDSGWVQKAKDRLDSDEIGSTQWLDSCAMTGQPRSEWDFYEVLGICRQGWMEVSLFPYAVGSKGVQLMQTIMSPETRASWGRFLAQHEGLTPDLRRMIHLDGA